ncbi:putative membrane protein YhdT [Kineosphaera limosa]|uniref:hypothetical protein n=1 Tax=Kineosphaera limosa TaxID=111564 RepID=UPI0003022CEC|nr:hypothetical protein [Kineosphaera limosa]NYE02477.1 putative membrane protein YhdT [Kineosphaera limosa]
MQETSLVAVAVFMLVIAVVDAWRIPDRERVAVLRLVRRGMPEPTDPEALVARRARQRRWLSLGSAAGLSGYLLVAALVGIEAPIVPWALLAAALWFAMLSAGCALLAKPPGAEPRVARLVSRRLRDYVPWWLGAPADLLVLAPMALGGLALASGGQRPAPWWFALGCLPTVLVLAGLAAWTRRLVTVPTSSADSATLLWTELERARGIRDVVTARIMTAVLATMTLFNAWYGAAGFELPAAMVPIAWAAGLTGLALVVLAVVSTWVEESSIGPTAQGPRASLRQGGVS